MRNRGIRVPGASGWAIAALVLAGGAAAAGAADMLAAGAGAAGAGAKRLETGDLAPAFSLPGTDGKTHTLAELQGKQAVVIAWFPKAFTGG